MLGQIRLAFFGRHVLNAVAVLAKGLGIIDQSNKDAKGLPLTVRSVFILKPDRTIALMMVRMNYGVLLFGHGRLLLTCFHPFQQTNKQTNTHRPTPPVPAATLTKSFVSLTVCN